MELINTALTWIFGIAFGIVLFAIPLMLVLSVLLQGMAGILLVISWLVNALAVIWGTLTGIADVFRSKRNAVP